MLALPVWVRYAIQISDLSGTPSADTLSSAPGGGGTPYDVLCGKAPTERGTFFRLQVYERVGISPVESISKGREICHLGM